MNLATLLIFSYTQLTHSDMSPFADATGLITFALAGCMQAKQILDYWPCLPWTSPSRGHGILGSLYVSEKFPTYPSPNPTFLPIK